MIIEIPIVFMSSGVALAGRFFRPNETISQRGPILIVSGSWLTVKEQMATVYARSLAAQGYTTFIFDFAGFGASRGEPREVEIPERKIMDIQAAASFVSTMSFVDKDMIGYVAICASAQYALAAVARGAKIRSLGYVAGWFHDAESVAPFYGGQDGVALRLGRARNAVEGFLATGELSLVPAYEPQNDRAGMFFELDYYGNESRGRVPSWGNTMSEMSWLYWLAFDGISSAIDVTTPALFIHSNGCALPENLRKVHNRVNGPKELIWLEDGVQIDYYDQPAYVSKAVEYLDIWFKKTLVDSAPRST